MISTKQIESAKRAIAKRFIDWCESGPQVTDLPAGTKACGQFLGSRSPQRGLHGTAAAIRVLANDGRASARKLVPELIEYVSDREQIESVISGTGSRADAARRDSENVIKLSELLFALSFVERGVGATDSLKADVARQLHAGMVEKRGWGYFLDATSETQLLPTAYAVRALASNDYDVSEPVAFMINALRVPAGQTADLARTDVSVRVLALHTLAFLKTQRELVDQGLLKELFLPLWRNLERLFYDDLEQNIEYSLGAEHFYVRVPYQLYLIGLAAKVAPFRSFASHAIQKRLTSILSAVDSPDGFYYPHSGYFVSSRTNAILYDILSTIEDEIPRHSDLFLPAYGVDRVRQVLSSPVVVWAGYLIGTGLIGLSVYYWFIEGRGLADLAPHFISAFVILVLSFRKSA